MVEGGGVFGIDIDIVLIFYLRSINPIVSTIRGYRTCQQVTYIHDWSQAN